MSKKIFYVLVVLFEIASLQTSAQLLSNPFDFPIQLSGGFCDLRADHFHSGIDIRTQGSEGHVLHAVRKGYISRISVSPWGYGNAIYITHPKDNIVTVYGHMQRFTYRITELVKKKQYKNESFAVDFTLDPSDLPVNQGDVIGYSGNSGSSGGPHLHFEVRDARTEELTDPLVYYKKQIPDTRKPIVRGVMIYPISDKGVVNGSSRKQKIEFKLDANDNPILKTKLEAWGEIGLSVRANDRMDGTNFSYGIKDILQTVDNVETFRFSADRFRFKETKYVNSCVDYEEFRKNHIRYFKTFVDPGNNLRMVASRNSGKIVINEEREYNVNITLTDIYGNMCKIPIKIIGKKQPIPVVDNTNTELLQWYNQNVFKTQDVKLSIPFGSLYDNVYMHYNSYNSSEYYSKVYVIHNSPVPLYIPAQLSIRMDTVSLLSNIKQFGIVHILNGRNLWIGGKYHDGMIEANINELGSYAVARDVNPPTITPVEKSKWRTNKQIKVRIKDDFSGVSTFRGEIDGKYALFEYDAKKSMLVYTFDDERLFCGSHRLKIIVKDGCGNRSVYEDAFTR